MKENNFYILFVVLLVMLFGNACKKDEYKNLDCSSISSTYNANIKPIINSNCTLSGCHNTGSSNGDYTTYNGLKAIADNGKLEDRVLNKKDMPSSNALSLDLRKKIKCWIEAGAPNN